MTNTAAAELPDLDPYAHLSAAELASAVMAWPEGSEEQVQALVALKARAPGIGHNKPPLAEALEAEIEPLRARADDLIELAGRALIVDTDSAKSVLDLRVKVRDAEAAIDAARLARSKPYRDATALINGIFGEVTQRLKIAREGESGRGGLNGMLTKWDDKQQAEAAAEHARLREEQRRREAAVAEAERKAREASEAGKGQVNAELEAAKARDEAAQARLRAAAVRPEPLRSHLGQMSRRREIRFEITDLGAAAGWLVDQQGLRNRLEQSVKTILGAYLHSLGIDAVAQGVAIPGVEARVEAGAATVRR